MSGGTDAIAGAIERSLRRLATKTGRQPLLIMSGALCHACLMLTNCQPASSKTSFSRAF